MAGTALNPSQSIVSHLPWNILTGTGRPFHLSDVKTESPEKELAYPQQGHTGPGFRTSLATLRCPLSCWEPRYSRQTSCTGTSLAGSYYRLTYLEEGRARELSQRSSARLKADSISEMGRPLAEPIPLALQPTRLGNPGFPAEPSKKNWKETQHLP